MNAHTINTRLHETMRNCFISAVMMMLFVSTIHAQTRNEFWNPALAQIAKPSSKPGAIEFRSDANLNALTVFSEYKTAFGLTDNDNMQLVRTNTDEIGFTHYRFQQYRNNKKIIGCEYIVHADASGRLISALGRLATSETFNHGHILAESAALQIALDKNSNNKLLSSNAAYMQKEMVKDAAHAKSLLPNAELVYAKRPDFATVKDNTYYLCYKFELFFENDAANEVVFIETNSGEVINRWPLSISCTGTVAPTIYNGNRAINTQQSGSVWNAVDDCPSSDIYVYDINNALNINNPTLVTSSNNTWNTPIRSSAAQVLWGVRKSYDYYLSTHSWQGFNNSNADINTYNNACWTAADGVTITGWNAMFTVQGNNGYLRFGAGTDMANYGDEISSIDVCGHEFTHGVTKYNSGLIYQGESGALNESFSDIFGEIVQATTLGLVEPTYLVGDDVGYIRNFITPEDKDHPSCYQDANWYSGSDDNGGVHTNSGVCNHWFFLLSEGGIGINSNGDYYNIDGIGWQKARSICWQMQSNYMISSTNYDHARECALQAAIALYGACSDEAKTVGYAWFAVGVGYLNPNDIEFISGTFNSPSFEERSAIRAIGNIANTPLTVDNSAADFRMHAGEQVILFDGFTAEAGCTFTAYLNECDFTIYRNAGPAALNNEGINDDENKAMTESVFNFMIMPNPAKDQAQLKFELSNDGNTSIIIYDFAGKVVMEFQDKFYPKGLNSVQLNLDKFNSGIYLAKLTAEGKSSSIKISVLR